MGKTYNKIKIDIKMEARGLKKAKKKKFMKKLRKLQK